MARDIMEVLLLGGGVLAAFIAFNLYAKNRAARIVGPAIQEMCRARECRWRHGNEEEAVYNCVAEVWVNYPPPDEGAGSDRTGLAQWDFLECLNKKIDPDRKTFLPADMGTLGRTDFFRPRR